MPYRTPPAMVRSTSTASLVTAVMPVEPAGAVGKQRPDVSQTWDWEGAEDAVAPAGAGVLVTELLVAGWSPQDRVDALTRWWRRWLADDRSAVSWPHSQKVSDPGRWRPTTSTGSSTCGSSRWPATTRRWCWTPSGCTCSACRTCSATSATGTRADRRAAVRDRALRLRLRRRDRRRQHDLRSGRQSDTSVAGRLAAQPPAGARCRPGRPVRAASATGGRSSCVTRRQPTRTSAGHRQPRVPLRVRRRCRSAQSSADLTVRRTDSSSISGR